MVIIFLPIIGLIFYIFFGINRRKEKLSNFNLQLSTFNQLTKRSMLQFVQQPGLELPNQHKPLIDLYLNQNLALPFNNNNIQIHDDGYSFFSQLFTAVGTAKHHIHVQFYIIDDDPLGRLFTDILIDKARQGVEVRVIYDDVGCWKTPHNFFERMRNEGIEVLPFLPVRFPSFTSKVNYRNHRKLVVIDGQTGFIGGMNVAIRYIKGKNHHTKPATVSPTTIEEANAPTTGVSPSGYKGKPSADGWRDIMLQVQGSGVYALQRAFLIDWYFTDQTLLSDRKYYPTIECPTDSNRPSHLGGVRMGSLLQVVTSSPTSPYPEIMQGYVHAIAAARQSILIETPYFLPTEPVLFALKMAALRGIDVRLIVPARNDTRFVEWAARSYLREAAEAGIQVLLYTQGFLHSKIMVIDDSLATCGSTNIDFRSFENNFECNVFIYDLAVATQLRDVFLQDQAQSQKLTDIPKRYHPSFTKRLLESLARLLAPLL